MKHFHLSQGDKQARLDRPLYLQKKIKSVLTLAPFIGNTCSLVIVLNSFNGVRLHRAIELGCTLVFSHWPGVAMEFARNFFPIPVAPRRGHSLAELSVEPGLASCPLEGNPSPLTGRGLPPAPLAPASLSGVWGGSKGLTVLIEPDRPPSRLGVFAEREMKGWVIFPRVSDRVLRRQGVTQNLCVPGPWAVLFKC